MRDVLIILATWALLIAAICAAFYRHKRAVPATPVKPAPVPPCHCGAEIPEDRVAYCSRFCLIADKDFVS